MQKNSFQKLVACVIVLFILLPGKEAFANYFTVTPGVEYGKGPTKWNNRSQSIHTVEVDVGRPEISVEAILPTSLDDSNSTDYSIERGFLEWTSCRCWY